MRNSSSAVLTALMLLRSLAARAQSADIKTLEDIETRFCKDIASMNVDAIMSLYQQGPSLHVYDMMKPREYKGSDALRKDWETFLAGNTKSIDKCDVVDFVPYVGTDLAAAHFVQHVEF